MEETVNKVEYEQQITRDAFAVHLEQMENEIADLKKQLAEKKEERRPLVNSNIQNTNTQQQPDLTAIMQWMATQAASKDKENQPKKPKSKRIRNDLGNGERSVRRYPDCNDYCHTCGFDISPNHLPCRHKKPGHDNTATITNCKGGCPRNCHFYKGPFTA